MAWTTPATAVAGSTALTAAFWNQQVRDNLNAVGLVHLDTTSFSAATSVSINDVFSSEYDAYRILITGTSSVAGNVNLRLRVSGSDNATANAYERQYLVVTNTSVAAGRDLLDAGVAGLFGSTASVVSIDIHGPALADETQCFSHSSVRGSGSNSVSIRLEAFCHTLSTAYDGFTLIRSSSNTLTGTVSTYGYQEV